MEQVEAEGRAERESKSLQPLGVATILRQNPATRPDKTKKSPAPRFHAASKAVRKGFWEAYRAFVAVFREAAERLKAGDRSARFPVGSFPPALPFVSPFPARPLWLAKRPSVLSFFPASTPDQGRWAEPVFPGSNPSFKEVGSRSRAPETPLSADPLRRSRD